MSGMTPARSAPVAEHLDFGAALKQALHGKRVRRSAWPVDGSCLFFSIGQDSPPTTGGVLRYRDGAGVVHDLIVQDGDVTATDWVVVLEH